jgi:hypothetical protein
MPRLLLSGIALIACACTGTPSAAPPPTGGPAADAGTPRGEPDAAENEAPDAGALAPDAIALPDGALPQYTWWQDVEPIVSRKCQLCHSTPPRFGAPRALVSYADTQGIVLDTGERVHVAMARRIRAPQSAMPPPNQPPLTEEEKTILEIWSAIGAPEGTPPTREDAGSSPDATPSTPDAGFAVDAGPAPADAGMQATLHTVDLLAHAPGDETQPYALPVENTNYVCWSFTIPSGSAFAVRFDPIIDNQTHIHHLLMFRDRSVSAGEGPESCDGVSQSWDMVAGWAPGQTGIQMPPGVGMRANPGDRYVLQAHYDRVMTPGQTDRSGMRVTLSDDRALIESGVLWHGLGWVNAINGANASHTWTCRMRTSVNIFSVFPHMHRTGTRITFELQRSGQQTWEMIAEVPAWSFDDQPNVTVPMNMQQLASGDKLKTTCWWDTQGRSISWGEASSDEMCFNFVNHYPLLPNANYTCVGIAP